MARDKHMVMVAFIQASNCSLFPGAWRHPADVSDYMSAEYYQRVARVLEAGKFHLAFFDDRLAMPDIYADDYHAAVQYGIRCIKMDPIPALVAMGTATKKLGLGATCSTTYYEPFHVARMFSSLDHITGGRAAWNVVTSLNDSEAANFGEDKHLAHDLRYDRANEFVEVVVGHWNSWGDNAIKADKKSGEFADPTLVRRLDHEGKWFKSRGPFTLPRTPQGQPVIIQAGQSGRGKAFASKWGDIIFSGAKSLESAQAVYHDIKSGVANAGRDPDSVKVILACYAIVGETRSIAKEKIDVLDSLAIPQDTLSLLSEITNFDFAKSDIDQPLSDDDLNSMTGQQTFKDHIIKASGKTNPTPRDFATFSRRGTIHDHPVFHGTAEDVVDQMSNWYEKQACDGFVLAAAHRPGSYEDFVRMVVPELQRRDLFQKDYKGNTLRENLGLENLRSRRSTAAA